MRPVLLYVAVLLLAAFIAGEPTRAWAAHTPQIEKPIGTFDAWRAYTYKEGGQTVCYMVTTKILKSTALKKRGTPYLMITHRPIEASTDVFSYGAGTTLNSRRGIKLQLAKSSFDLFSVSDIAWARDGITDHKIASALRNEPTAHVTAFPSQKGARKIGDVFDLKGATLAYQAIGKACGLIHMPSKKKSKKGIQKQKSST